jgi:hypothetical protein
MQQRSFLLATTILITVSLGVACNSGTTGLPDSSSPDSSLPDLAADAGPAQDTGRKDAVSGSDTRVLPDSRTVDPTNVKCLPEWATDNSCTCTRTSPGANDLATCSAVSVLSSQFEQGICCEDYFDCICTSYGCASSSSLGICECGAAGAANLPGSSAVLECGPFTAGQKCCLDANAHSCICSSADCLAGSAVEVPTCTVASIVTCASDATAWANCK